MRRQRLGIALLAAALSGCWIFDELDAGSKKIDMYSKKKPEAEAPAEPAPRAKGPRAAEYFANQKKARTFTPGSVSPEIVSCKVDGSTQFMKRVDCINRGGIPAG